MEIQVIENNTYISLKHKDGSFPNCFTFIFARSGYGKTLFMESLIEEFYRAGYTVLILSDVKDEFELGYAMFPPKKPYHLNRLKNDGKPIETKPVKLYHPFTLNIPSSKIPEINFYGFSLKDLRRPEWSMLTESAWESDTIRLLLNASSSISPNQGLFDFLHFIQDNIVGRKEGQSYKPDPNAFHLRTTGGTAKSLQDVASYFMTFKKHPFLVSDNSDLKKNLDWKKILEDQKHYHVFGTRWIDDEKLKEFTILVLLNQILRNRKFTTKPCLIIIPEIRFLVPIRPKGYKEFLAKGITSNLSIMRNVGRGGNSFATDSQVWSDVDESVRNSGTNTFYGELGGSKDIENVTKSMRYKSDRSQQLKHSDYPRSVIMQEQPEENWDLWLPGHCHAEEEYDFFEMYKGHFYEKMQSYKPLIDKIKTTIKEEENKIKEKIKKQIQKEKEEIEKKKAEKEARKQESTQKIEEKVEKVKEKEEQTKEVLMKLAWEIHQDRNLEPSERSYRAIGRKLDLNHITVKKYVKEFQNKLDNENNTPVGLEPIESFGGDE